MKILLFGATGLAGGGVLRACLDAPDVTLALDGPPYFRLCTCLTHASTSGCMGPFVAA